MIAVGALTSSLLAAAASGEADLATERFALLVADFEAHSLASDPIRAGRQGDLRAAARWPDASFEAVAEYQRVSSEFHRRLEAIDVDALDSNDQISYRVLAHLLRFREELAPFEPQRIGFTNDSGFFSLPLQLATATRPANVAEAEAWIARLESLPVYFAQHLAWLERGLADGFVQPGLVGERVLDQLRVISDIPAAEHPLLAPMQKLPERMPAEQRERLRRSAHSAIIERALPAYRELRDFFAERYLAEPRGSVAVSALPGGEDYYRSLVRYHTTLDVSPEWVHEQGLAEVARIREDMLEVIAQTDFEGSFEDFLHYLRTDPRFYAQTERELLIEAAWIAKRADDAMPRFFRRLPRLPYGVRPVPAEMAPNYTTGRYWAGDLANGVAGGYMVNTYRLDQRPLHELPALTLHEAVPGHHHQIALAQELEDVPEFRRNTYITAFGEGWALYTEWLGIEMGIYQTPYEHFGRLSYEMWRACRLVVDTGLHMFGWSREQAEACLLENSALAPHNVRTEIERYIAWPGQALAYKPGEMLIRRLRAEAEERLGERFDLRDFHDHLLAVGALPLSELETRMRAWMTSVEDN